jgi:SAM-dependent methyltransferase
LASDNVGVNYDECAADFDRRYELNAFDGVEDALDRYIGAHARAVAEVGCGTGQWLARIQRRVDRLTGFDPSIEMLRRAKTKAPRAHLVRARAEDLPCVDASFERIFCVNALHHFTDAQSFFRDAARALCSGGELMTVGLDPHNGQDGWWIYDYFPGSLEADRKRYLSAAEIRRRMLNAGFVDIQTELVQHIAAELPYADALARGVLDRRSTSQLLLLTDADFEKGLQRLERDCPIMKANLRIYGTFGRKSA